jgi:hypothetical protein
LFFSCIFWRNSAAGPFSVQNKIDKIGGVSTDSRGRAEKDVCRPVGAYFMIPKDEKTKR